MIYILKQAVSLAETLTRMSHLPAHRLAGHVANMDYWKDEVVRTLTGLAEYNARFKKLKATTSQYLKDHPLEEADLPLSVHHVHGLKPDVRTTKPVTDPELKAASAALEKAMAGFLDACLNAGVLSLDDVADSSQTYR